MSGPGTATTAEERGTGPGARGTEGRGLSVPVEASAAAAANALATFVKLLGDGPRDAASAPLTLTLPAVLAAGISEQLDAALGDGAERGLLFGYTSPRLTLVTAYVTGTEDAIDYAPARRQWPGVRFVGTFHVHITAVGVGEDGRLTGGTGGGHSGADLAAFYRRAERASMVGSEAMDGRRWLYLILKQQGFSIPGTPHKVAELYHARVMARLARGAQPHEASLAELTSLARAGAFVLYTGVDGRTLSRV